MVYAARQASIDRTVAVKMLKPDVAGDAEQREKFLSEAVVTGELDHPNIVPIYDLGSERGRRAVLLDEARAGHAVGQGHRAEDARREPRTS